MSFRKPYWEHPEALARRASAIRLAEVIAAADGPILDPHRRRLLSTTVWKMTEADDKHNLRYRSRAALDAASKSDVRHEHVIPRAVLVQRMIDEPHRVAEILSEAVACLVTKEEHRRLGRGSGWERYKLAGIEVVDMVDGSTVDGNGVG